MKNARVAWLPPMLASHMTFTKAENERWCDPLTTLDPLLGLPSSATDAFPSPGIQQTALQASGHAPPDSPKACPCHYLHRFEDGWAGVL